MNILESGPVIDTLHNLSLLVPDLAVMLGFAVVFGFLAVSVSWLSHRFFWASAKGDFEHGGKDAGDGVHTSILALIAFLMALIASSELTNFAEASRDVTAESLQIHRFDRDLQELGEDGANARKLLKSYVDSVVTDEWVRLGNRPQSLSPESGAALEALWREMREVQARLLHSNGALASDLGEYMHKIEESRLGRLSGSIDNIPGIVWLLIAVLFLAAWVLNGRHKMTWRAAQMSFIHMSALGLMLSLIVIIDNPFGGDTSLDPARISDALLR